MNAGGQSYLLMATPAGCGLSFDQVPGDVVRAGKEAHAR